MAKSTARLDYAEFAAIAPDVHSALVELSRTANQAGLERSLMELVRLRVSQINECAYCVGFHLNLLRHLDVTPTKLDFLVVWREVDFFTPRERAALAWAEELTRLEGHGVPDAAYAAVGREFNKNEVLYLTVAIGTINQWNRIAVALRFTPPSSR